MTLTSEIFNDINEKAWDEQLLKNNISSVYQSYNWARLYKEVFNSKPIFILIKDSSKKIIGQLLAFIHNDYYWINANPFFRKIGTKLNLGSIILWWHGPIIHDTSNQANISKEIILALHNIAQKNQIMMIRGASSPLSRQLDEKLFKSNGFKIQPWGTYVIDLQQSIDTLYKKLNKKIRYDIRKGEKNKLEFEVSDDKKTLDDYIELKHKERERTGQKTTRIPLYNEKYWNYLHNNGHLKLFVTRYNNQLVGGILGITFNGNIIQHGVLNLRNDLSAGPFLTWNALKWSIQNNYRTFDMGGFNPFPESEKEKAIDFFKAKWCGDELDYNLYTKVLDKTKFSLSTVLLHPKRASKKLLKLILK